MRCDSENRDMVWPIVCGVRGSLIAFVLTLKLIVGDNSETRALRKRLKFYGVEPQGFSSGCLTELIEAKTRHLCLVEFPTERAMHVAIDKVAIEVRNIVMATGGFDPASVQENASWLILERYDPEHFCQEKMATTYRLHSNVAPGRKPEIDP